MTDVLAVLLAALLVMAGLAGAVWMVGLTREEEE